MEVASLQQQQHLGDSFSRRWLKRALQAPSFERLADAGVGYSFGSSRSFIDMDPSVLFSMRWTATATPSDFDFVLPESGEPAASSPVFISGSQIFRGGRLLPGAQEDDGGVDAYNKPAGRLPDLDFLDTPSAPPPWASSPLFHSAPSTPCSVATSGTGKHARPRPVRRGGSPWKVLLRYLRFLMPLYKKAIALRPVANTNRVSPASPGRGSSSSSSSISSMEWCHGNADTAVDDAILYCKKSRGQGVLA